MIQRKIVHLAWLIMQKLFSETSKVGLKMKDLDIFRESNLVSQEAYLVTFCFLLQCVFVCANENMKAAALGFSKESFPCSGVCIISNTRIICGHASANMPPFPHKKWTVTSPHSVPCPKK